MGDFLYRFFFQAEDGIRDSSVTGVQTCALPICLAAEVPTLALILYVAGIVTGGWFIAPREIGRASCRGKSVDLGGRRIIKKKTKSDEYRIEIKCKFKLRTKRVMLC